MAIVISEQMYMSFQERGINEDTELLGFATYLENNAAFEKRKETVDHWGSQTVTTHIHKDDPRWDHEADNQMYQQITTARPDLAPKITDNPLLSGFKIAREVRRHGWGSGNVVWRIEDPRGFELEISSANMASIMDTCVVDHGEIMTACRWGWNKSNGSRVVLLPEGTEPYIEAVADNELHNAKPLKIGDIDIGDVVKLKNGTVCAYLGGYFYIEAKELPYDNQTDHKFIDRYKWQSSKKKTHFFREEDGRLFVMASPKIANVIKKAETVTSIQDGAEEVNTLLRLELSIDSFNNVDPVAVSPTTILDEDISTHTTPITTDDAMFILDESRYRPIHYSYRKYPILFEHEGAIYRHEGAKFSVRTGEDAIIKGNRLFMKSLEEDNTYCVSGSLVRDYYSRKYTGNLQPNYIDLPEIEVNKCPMSILTIQFNNQQYLPRIY